jgi:hypothetical protein
MMRLTDTAFKSRGRSHSLVTAIGFVVVASGAFPAYHLLRGPFGEAFRSGFSKMQLAGMPDGGVPSRTAEAWMQRRIHSRENHPFNGGTRTMVLYEDGAQVYYIDGQGGSSDRLLTIIDPTTRKQRTLTIDEEGRPSSLRVVNFDDRMQVVLAEETATSDAMSDGVPLSRTLRMLDADGNLLNTPGRIAPGAEFIAAAHTTAEDLRYFRALLR